MGFFDKLFGGKSKDENTAKFTNQSKTVLTPLLWSGQKIQWQGFWTLSL